MSAACRSCCAAPSTARPRSCTSASRPTGCCTRCARRTITLVSVVATTLTRLLDAGLARRRACAWRWPAAARSPAALLERAARGRRAGQPDVRPHRVLLAGHHGAGAAGGARQGEHGAGPPLFCTRVRIGPTARSCCAARRSPPGPPARTAGWPLATSAASTRAGSLHVTGRKADTIISGGENVAPAEVEAVLEAHPDVLEAAVIARADPEWGEAVTALVVRPRRRAAGPRGPARALRGRAGRRTRCPRRVLLADGPLPRTRSGKLLRREL